MRSGINQSECQNIILDQIDQKPVGLDMAFVKTDVLAFEHMILIHQLSASGADFKLAI